MATQAIEVPIAGCTKKAASCINTPSGGAVKPPTMLYSSTAADPCKTTASFTEAASLTSTNSALANMPLSSEASELPLTASLALNEKLIVLIFGALSAARMALPSFKVVRVRFGSEAIPVSNLKLPAN